MRVWVSIASLGATLCALPLLQPLFNGAWAGGPIQAVLLVGMIGLAGRSVGLPASLLPMAQALGVLCLVTARNTAEHALVGVVPTPSSIEALNLLLAGGRTDIIVNPTPVLVTAGIDVILVIAIGLLAILVDVLAVTLRTPALSGLVFLVLLFVPLVVQHEGVGWLPFSVATLGFVVLLAVDSWGRAAKWGARIPEAPAREAPARRPDPGEASGAGQHAQLAVRVGAVAVVGALLLPTAVPGLSTDAVFALASDRSGESNSVTTSNPLVSLRRELASLSDQRILEYRTSTRTPEYLRTHVLDSFDGVNWTMSPVRTARQYQVGDGENEFPDLSGQWREEELVETRITVSSALQDVRFLPLPHPTSELEVSREWYVDPDTRMVFSVHDMAAGLSYTARGPEPDFSRADLADAPFPDTDEVGEQYVDIPDELDPAVRTLTEDIVSDAATPHERAVALQDWFTDGKFEYSLEPPTTEGDLDPLSTFLFQSRVGYCEQFAAAMTIMARIAGIPARVAVGYTSGDNVGTGRWVVTGQHAHAWPELYFEGYGWLRFEPTPSSSQGQGSASVPAYAHLAAPDTTSSGDTVEDSADERPSQDGETAPPEENSAEEPVPDDASSTADGIGPVVEEGGPWWLPPAALTALVLLLLPALARHLARQVRWARADGDAARAHAAWAELHGSVRDLALEWNPAESPRATAHRLAEEYRLATDAREALWRVALAEESARYAPEPAPAPTLREDSWTVRGALGSAAGRRARIRALLLPRSVFLLPRLPRIPRPGATRARI